MGVDFLVCKRCGNTFPDCGDYVNCEDCGTDWCCDECAEDDGYIREYCKLGKCVEGGSNDEECKFANENKEWGKCTECENYVPTSCKYCRCEDYEDSYLLEVAMKLLKCDRQYLIDTINSKE